MKQAIDQFRTNIERVRQLSTIFEVFVGMTTDAIDLSDVLRAELVLAVSALDHFIHEIIYFGMLEICKGSRTHTDAYYRFSVPLQATHSAIDNSQTTEWLETVIRQAHGWKSFQNPDNIAEGIRLISSVKLWNEVSQVMRLSPKDVKLKLKMIVDRRNKIAHEADMDPTVPGSRWPIYKADVDQAVDFIHTLGETIYQVI